MMKFCIVFSFMLYFVHKNYNKISVDDMRVIVNSIDSLNRQIKCTYCFSKNNVVYALNILSNSSTNNIISVLDADTLFVKNSISLQHSCSNITLWSSDYDNLISFVYCAKESCINDFTILKLHKTKEIELLKSWNVDNIKLAAASNNVVDANDAYVYRIYKVNGKIKLDYVDFTDVIQ